MGHVRGYLSSKTTAEFWIYCKYAIPAFIFSKSLGVNIAWNKTDKLTVMEQSK
jgi:hypothetical protein